MVCLNDGTATHVNRRTGKESAPDVTIVHANQAEKYEWRVLEGLGGSDHKPILITKRAENRLEVNNNTVYKCRVFARVFGKGRVFARVFGVGGGKRFWVKPALILS